LSHVSGLVPALESDSANLLEKKLGTTSDVDDDTCGAVVPFCCLRSLQTGTNRY
jgi:hypothetical protein